MLYFLCLVIKEAFWKGTIRRYGNILWRRSQVQHNGDFIRSVSFSLLGPFYPTHFY